MHRIINNEVHVKQILTREDIEEREAAETYDAINKLVKNLLKETNDPGLIAYTLFYIGLDMSYQTCDDHNTVMANFLGAQLAYYHPKADEKLKDDQNQDDIKLIDYKKNKEKLH
tara:strand:- start:339 stop:680 length:342 start_codon:yes stop_codon:yes gene_type:complete